MYISKAMGYNGRGKSSGLWGAVSYGGVSGHCSMNYLEKETGYALSFDATGGTVTPNSLPCAQGAAVGTLPTPSKSGYSFAGWFTVASGGTQYTASTICTGSVTLYARWTADETQCNCSTAYAGYYTVTGTSSGDLAINSGEGYKESEGFRQLGSIPEGTTVYISKAMGYNSRGKSSGLWGAVNYGNVSGHCSMNYLEKVTQATVSFNANGGTVSPASKAVSIDSQVGTLPTPTLSGYTFAGWYTAISSGSAYTSATVCTGSVALYAHWRSIAEGMYSLILDPMGGSVPVSSFACADGSLIVNLPVPSRDGYAFTGWYTSRALTARVTEAAISGGNTTLYAGWVSLSPALCLPNGCERVEADAFAGNSSVEVIDLRGASENLSIGSGAFANCPNLKAILVDRHVRELYVDDPQSLLTGCGDVTVYADVACDAASYLEGLGLPVYTLADEDGEQPAMHAYKRFDAYQTWQDAKAYCESMGGHLATAATEDEQYIIDRLMTQTPRTLYFVGATDDGSEGVWRWITGEPFSYLHWADTQPDNWNTCEHSMSIYGSLYPSADGQWNDSSNIGYIPGDASGYWKLHTQFGFICEWEQI